MAYWDTPECSFNSCLLLMSVVDNRSYEVFFEVLSMKRQFFHVHL